ncbi:arrestin domain-containing protein 3-like isoform X2 [Tubulanus polymorphus]|uniref:arrestin domain-containing protein 3-like isoform X2 n=1 Tax=Tubulanus polymorphus TaxID=672921 RepID=UPI003DA31A14
MPGKVSLFHITFDRANPVYYEGETVSGCLTLRAEEPLKTKGVRLMFSGKAHVGWDYDSSGGAERQREYGDMARVVENHSNDETYLNCTVCVCGDSRKGRCKCGYNNNKEFVLEPNQYMFPFKLELPENLPPSFESKFGWIRYEIKCNLDMTRSMDVRASMPFTIKATVDLNKYPEMKIPKEVEKGKTLCCCCCETGPIRAQLILERTGYVPGEGIKLMGEIENDARREIQKTEVKLLQKIKCTASDGDTQEITNEINKIYGDVIRAGRTFSWEDYVLPVGNNLPPSPLPRCRIIKITYTLELTVHIPGPTKKLKIMIPLVIGTQPYDGMYSPYVPPHGFLQGGKPVPSLISTQTSFDEVTPTSGIANHPCSMWLFSQVIRRTCIARLA